MSAPLSSGKAWFKVWQIDGMAGIATNWSDNARAEVLVGGVLADFNSWDDIRSPRDWELLRHDFQDLAGPWVRNRMAWLVPQIDRNGGGTSRIEWGGAEPMVAPAGAIRLNPGGEAPPQGVGDGGPWLYLEWHDLATIEVEHPAPYDREYLCLVRRHKQYHQEPDEVVGTVTFKVAAGETEPTTEFDGLAPNDLCRATADGLLEMGPTYGPVFPWGIYPIHLGGDPANDPDPAYPAFDECDVVPVPLQFVVPETDENDVETGELIRASELHVAKMEDSLNQNEILTLMWIPTAFMCVFQGSPKRERYRSNWLPWTIPRPPIMTMRLKSNFNL